jgi:hypothetical protein
MCHYESESHLVDVVIGADRQKVNKPYITFRSLSLSSSLSIIFSQACFLLLSPCTICRFFHFTFLLFFFENEMKERREKSLKTHLQASERERKRKIVALNARSMAK